LLSLLGKLITKLKVIFSIEMYLLFTLITVKIPDKERGKKIR